MRKIAIFTDVHGLYEPLKAILDDIEKRGIKEIYSLGDNIGLGPNPCEVINLLRKKNVISLAGNSEDYITLGVEPFSYLKDLKLKNREWTFNQLNKNQRDYLANLPHSISLFVGGKHIGLCHFANDVRCDYGRHSTWEYQKSFKAGKKAYRQFFYTNSLKQKKKILGKVENNSNENLKKRGYLSAFEEPLFNGKKVSDYDYIIQGHVHFKMYEESKKTKFYTIRALGMAYEDDPKDSASYIILNEEDNDIKIEEILVKYDRKMMKKAIKNSISDNTIIRKFIVFDE